MSWITDFINNLPEIIDAIGPGFLLLATFSWATSKKYESATNVVVMSVVLSYLIGELCLKLAPKGIEVGIVTSCVFSASSGFALAIIYKHELFNKLIAFLGIKRTTNHTIWDDVVGEKAWIAIFDEKINGYYCGQFKYQNYENATSYIVLATYYIADSDGKLVKSYEQEQRQLMLNLDKYEKIIVSKEDPFGHFEIKTNKKG